MRGGAAQVTGRASLERLGQCRPLAACEEWEVLDATMNRCLRSDCSSYMMHRNAVNGECEVSGGAVTGIVIVLLAVIGTDFFARRCMLLSVEEAAYGKQRGRRWEWWPLQWTVGCCVTMARMMPCLRCCCCCRCCWCCRQFD